MTTAGAGRVISFAAATLEAMDEEMARDDAVFLMGEDIARQGGIFGQFKGLPQKYGFERVRDTPISEATLVGATLGAALAGARPVFDMHFSDFALVAMDEIISQIAKIRYMSGGQVKIPLVLRMPDGAVHSTAAQHSQSLEAFYLHAPGLRVVAPSNPADAKGLLQSAIRLDDPVIYLEHKALYSLKGEVPEGEHLVPIGKAAVAREGRDVTIISYSLTLQKSLKAAQALAEAGISCEVIDLRSLSPLDWDTVTQSVAKTRRAVVAHESWRDYGPGAEIASTLSAEFFGRLLAPVARVGARHVPIPFSPPLEEFVIPQVADIVAATKGVAA